MTLKDVKLAKCLFPGGRLVVAAHDRQTDRLLVAVPVQPASASRWLHTPISSSERARIARALQER